MLQCVASIGKQHTFLQSARQAGILLTVRSCTSASSGSPFSQPCTSSMHIITFMLQGKSQHLPMSIAYVPRKRGQGKEEQKTYLLATCRARPSQSPLAELRLAPGLATGENQGKIPHPMRVWIKTMLHGFFLAQSVALSQS